MSNYISIDVEPTYIDDSIEFYYDRETNKMIDCNGAIVFDIFRHITPSQLYLFKELGNDMVVIGKKGTLVTLLYGFLYPNEYEEYDYDEPINTDYIVER